MPFVRSEDRAATIGASKGRAEVVNEEHFMEIERALLNISDAKERVDRAAKGLRKDDADAHLVTALEEATAELFATYKKLMQRTYYAVPPRAEDRQEQLSV